ncbi:MAG TPA: transcriptional repressor LexA [Bacillota bacterium]
MPDAITRRQQEILDYIRKVVWERGYPPSVREIGEAVGLSSSSTVHGHLDRLEEKGLIHRDATKPRALEVVDEREMRSRRLVQVPMVGRVTAGEPILAVENIEETYPLPFDLIRDENVFMLTVRGDSMIEAGILDGDYVIVRRQSTAQNGDVVVAMIDEEATVKRFFKENGHFRLQPENSALAPFIVSEVTILGKVIGLFRHIR